MSGEEFNGRSSPIHRIRRCAAALMCAFAAVLALNSAFLPRADAAGDGSSPDELAADGFAVLEITLDGYGIDEIDKDARQPMTYTLRYDGVTLENQSAAIKGRGNYTWTQPKKPFAIKCDEKTDWFGFGKSRNWVLLANITDQTLMRNMVALELASKFDFAFTPEFRPAHVFINGDYQGLYLITEKVEIGKNRLEIDYRSGDSLWELDNNYGWSEPDSYSSPLGNLFVLKDPSREKLEEEAAELKTGEELISFSRAFRTGSRAIMSFENGLKSKDLEKIAGVMNMDSLVDWYIFNEIMKNDDTLFNSSIYLWYDYGENRLNMGPVWDYDLSMGGIDRNDGKNVDPEGFMFTEDYWGRDSANWFKTLLAFPEFNDMVSARWTELYSAGVFEYIKAYIDKAERELTEPQKANSRLWGIQGVFVRSDNYAQAVDVLRGFVTARIDWLNRQWNPAAATPAPVTAPPTREPLTPAPESTGIPATAAPELTEGPEMTADHTAPPGARSRSRITALDIFKYALLFAGTLTATVLVILGAFKLSEKRRKGH